MVLSMRPVDEPSSRCMVTVLRRLSMSMARPPGCRLIRAIADASDRSSRVRMGISTTALGGGSWRRTASHATVNDATMKSTKNVANSLIIDGQWTSMSLTGTRGMGTKIEISSPTPMPPKMLAQVTSPHRSCHMTTIHRKRMNEGRLLRRSSRLSGFATPALFLSGLIVPPPVRRSRRRRWGRRRG